MIKITRVCFEFQFGGYHLKIKNFELFIISARLPGIEDLMAYSYRQCHCLSIILLYYLKDYNNIMKKTTLKKLNKLLKDKDNKKIFEMTEQTKLMDYLYIYKHFIMRECLNICNIIIVGENKELLLITNNNKPYY
jgi:hypothetical protein